MRMILHTVSCHCPCLYVIVSVFNEINVVFFWNFNVQNIRKKFGKTKICNMKELCKIISNKHLGYVY